MSHDVPSTRHEKTQTSADNQIEKIAEQFRFSKNAYTLGELVKKYEEKRERDSRQNPGRYGPFVPVQAKVEAYMQRQIGARMHVEKVSITNIGTIRGELKIDRGNIRSRLEDEMTVFLDPKGITELGLEEELFDTNEKITFIGPDPKPTLEERIRQQEESARLRMDAASLVGLAEATEETTGIRHISDITGLKAKGAINDK